MRCREGSFSACLTYKMTCAGHPPMYKGPNLPRRLWYHLSDLVGMERLTGRVGNLNPEPVIGCTRQPPLPVNVLWSFTIGGAVSPMATDHITMAVDRIGSKLLLETAHLSTDNLCLHFFCSNWKTWRMTQSQLLASSSGDDEKLAALSHEGRCASKLSETNLHKIHLGSYLGSVLHEIIGAYYITFSICQPSMLYLMS